MNNHKILMLLAFVLSHSGVFANSNLSLSHGNNLMRKFDSSVIAKEKYFSFTKDLNKKTKGAGITDSEMIGEWSLYDNGSGEVLTFEIVDASSTANSSNKVTAFSFRLLDQDDNIVTAGMGLVVNSFLVFTRNFVNGSKTYYLLIKKSRSSIAGSGLFLAQRISDCEFDVGDKYTCTSLETPELGYETSSLTKL
jgi:hypothetical protein